MLEIQQGTKHTFLKFAFYRRESDNKQSICLLLRRKVYGKLGVERKVTYVLCMYVCIHTHTYKNIYVYMYTYVLYMVRLGKLSLKGDILLET